ESLMHPRQLYFKRMAISRDAPLAASRFVNSTNLTTCEQAIAFVAAMAWHDPSVRDYYLHNSILSLLCPLVLASPPLNILTQVAHALAGLCGVSHPANDLPSWDLIQPAFVPLGHLLFSDHEAVLTQVLSAFAIILPGMNPDGAIISRILELVH